MSVKHWPRRLKWACRVYPGLGRTPVLDVGCGRGVHLQWFAPGSVGMDARDGSAGAGGHPILGWDFESEITGVLAAAGRGQFKAMWCNDVIEHHPSPHLFLLNLRRALPDDGVLFLGLPLVNPIGASDWSAHVPGMHFFRGYLSQDHINFFSFQSIRDTLRFAGFRVHSWYSPFLPFSRPWMCGLEPVTIFMLSKVPGFNYGPKAYKTLDANGHLKWKDLGATPVTDLPGDVDGD